MTNTPDAPGYLTHINDIQHRQPIGERIAAFYAVRHNTGAIATKTTQVSPGSVPDGIPKGVVLYRVTVTKNDMMSLRWIALINNTLTGDRTSRAEAVREASTIQRCAAHHYGPNARIDPDFPADLRADIERKRDDDDL